MKKYRLWIFLVAVCTYLFVLSMLDYQAEQIEQKDIETIIKETPWLNQLIDFCPYDLNRTVNSFSLKDLEKVHEFLKINAKEFEELIKSKNGE